MHPKSREADLVIHEVAGETLVYDVAAHRVHCLNPFAAAVWRRCDGHTSVPDLVEALSLELSASTRQDLVDLALKQLHRARLLEGNGYSPDALRAVSRRDVARKLALVGGISALLPVVTSMIAPTNASAATCQPPDGCCQNNNECCSGTCGKSALNCLPRSNKACL